MPLEQFLIEPMRCRDCDHSINQHGKHGCEFENLIESNLSLQHVVTEETCMCLLHPMDIVRYHIHREIEERSKS